MSFRGSFTLYDSWDSVLEEWVTEPEIGGAYVIGIDTAEGSGSGDYQAAVILKVEGVMSKVVGVYHDRLDVFEFARDLRILGRAFNDAFLVPEGNDYSFCKFLVQEEEGYDNCYFRETRENFYSRTQEKTGYRTDKRSKLELVDTMVDLYKRRLIEIPDEILLDEMMRFQWPGPGSAAQTPRAITGHDDLVMALGFACIGIPRAGVSRRPRLVKNNRRGLHTGETVAKEIKQLRRGVHANQRFGA